MIWVMMPTNEFWLHWLPHIHAKTDSTYLGQKGLISHNPLYLETLHISLLLTSFALAGANILIYTFPILLIAVLGCLYLHLDKYGDDPDTHNRYMLMFLVQQQFILVQTLFIRLHFVCRRRDDQYFASWKQPLLVRGPLGVISRTELLFMLMFVVLLVWSFSAYLHGMFNNITRESASKMGDVV